MSGMNCCFQVGQVIHHRLFDYRGVIVECDAVFSGSDDWYEQVARSRPPRDRPWYHVLVHGSTHTTYVAERNLAVDESGNPVAHPLLGLHFDEFENGMYGVGGPAN
jgi:heat shock protein HspQ